MYRILTRYFDGVSRAQFRKDLDQKNWVILLERDDRTLAGFSTLLCYGAEHEGERLTVIYSGDTIVDRAAWGSSALPRAWIQTVLGLERAEGAERLIWLLIVSGFRTYRFLPVFFREFFPSFDRSASPGTGALVAKLARERFGSDYDAARGVVHFTNPQRLCPELAQIPQRRRSSPHVKFFERRNPGHAAGDELVCLAELSETNLTRAGRRMLGGGLT